jgi:hypothetical protein
MLEFASYQPEPLVKPTVERTVTEYCTRYTAVIDVSSVSVKDLDVDEFESFHLTKM